MSSKCSETDPTTEQENVDRIVCNSCSIEFENVEQLVQHTQYAHTEPSRGVTCGKCEIDFIDITGQYIYSRGKSKQKSRTTFLREISPSYLLVELYYISLTG